MSFNANDIRRKSEQIAIQKEDERQKREAQRKATEDAENEAKHNSALAEAPRLAHPISASIQREIEKAAADGKDSYHPAEELAPYVTLGENKTLVIKPKIGKDLYMAYACIEVVKLLKEAGFIVKIDGYYYDSTPDRETTNMKYKHYVVVSWATAAEKYQKSQQKEHHFGSA